VCTWLGDSEADILLPCDDWLTDHILEVLRTVMDYWRKCHRVDSMLTKDTLGVRVRVRV